MKFEDSAEYRQAKEQAEKEGKQLVCLPIGDREWIAKEVKQAPAAALVSMMIEVQGLHEELEWTTKTIKGEMVERVKSGKADGESAKPAPKPFTTGDPVKDSIHAILAGGDLETAELKGEA